MKLQVLRNGVIKPLDLTITLEPLSGAGVSAQMLKDSVAYIRIPFFNDETFVQLTSALKGLERQTPPLKGLILDLRNNARGTLEQGVRNASAWLGEKQIVSTKGRTPEVNQSYQGKAQDLVFKSPLPMVVLIDQGTGRAAEIVAGALKDQWGATLLGEKSLGLCGLTRVVPLQDGSALVMTVAQCYTPKGQKIQGKGLEPDVQGKKASVTSPAKEPPKTLTPDQDPWVNQALEVIKSGKSPKLAVKGQS
jgi:carboxyl-terminal processing protease